MKAKVFNQKGKEIETVDLNDGIFKVEVKPNVISQYVFMYLSNQRQSNAQTKDRSEVRGGGKKPWRQKGTGRARVGSSRSPIWRKGGVVFGPSNEINFKKKLTKSFRKAVLKNVLSNLIKEDKLRIIDALTINEKNPLTKQALEVSKSFKNPRKLFVVTSNKKDEVIKAFSNIENHKVEMVQNVNSYDLMNGGLVLVEKDAINFLTENLSSK